MTKLYKDKREGKGNRRTNSQWRAIGMNYHPIMPFDWWCDLGRPEPAPRIFGRTQWMELIDA